MSQQATDPVYITGRVLEAEERDNAGAYEDHRPASKRNLKSLERLGIPEIDAADIELTPRKALKRDGGFYRYFEGVLDERAGDFVNAFARVNGRLVLLREPGLEPSLRSEHIATINTYNVEDVVVHMPSEYGGIR